MYCHECACGSKSSFAISRFERRSMKALHLGYKATWREFNRSEEYHPCLACTATTLRVALVTAAKVRCQRKAGASKESSAMQWTSCKVQWHLVTLPLLCLENDRATCNLKPADKRGVVAALAWNPLFSSSLFASVSVGLGHGWNGM